MTTMDHLIETDGVKMRTRAAIDQPWSDWFTPMGIAVPPSNDRANLIKMLREREGVSMQEAKRMIEREELHDEIDQAHDIEAIKTILHKFVDKLP